MAIAIESNDELVKLRQRLRKMADEALVGFGKTARGLSRNRDCPDTFMRQLEGAYRAQTKVNRTEVTNG